MDAIYQNTRTGRHDMAYRGSGGKPWHHLGESMEDFATLDDWYKAAGFDFRILKAPLFYVLPDGADAELINGHATNGDGITRNFSKIANRFALVRSDTGRQISIMSNRYKVHQPDQIWKFFDKVCSQMGFEMETAGVLKQGATYWALARVPVNGPIANDEHRAYVMIATSSDGSMTTQAMLTSVRVVCWNTLQAAVYGSDGKRHVSVKHTTELNVDKVVEELGLVDFEQSWQRFRNQMEALQGVKVSGDEATAFFSELLRPTPQKAKPRGEHQAQSFADLLNAPAAGGYSPVETDKAAPERAIRGLAELEKAYINAPGAVPGTAYGLVQGVTRFIDHERGKDGDKRLTSAWFGQGEQIKERALTMASDLAGIAA